MTFEVGDEIHHEGEQGRFRVVKIRSNGDLDCWGGLGGSGPLHTIKGHASMRTFRAKECRLAKAQRKLRVEDADA